MRELIYVHFKGSEKQIVAVTKFVATWTDDINSLRQHLIKLP